MPSIMSDEIVRQMEILSRTPFHSITRIRVKISTDPAQRQVYKIGNVRNDDGKSVPTYALTKLSIDQLLSTAGVEEVESDCVEIEPGLWRAFYRGKYTFPDGSEYKDKKSKVIDLRIGGSRWATEKQKHVDSGVVAWAKANGIEQRKKPREYWDDYIVRASIEIEDRDPEQLERIERFAGKRATRTITEHAKFAAELAESGAVERYARAIFQLRPYTARELRDPFIVYRSQFDWKALQDEFGEEVRNQYALIAAQTALGISVETKDLLPATAAENKEELGPFDIQASTELLDKIADHFGGRDINAGSQVLFEKDLDEITQGEAILELEYIELANSFPEKTEEAKAVLDSALALVKEAVEERTIISLDEVQVELPYGNNDEE